MKRRNRLMLVIGVGLAALSFVAVLAFGGFGQAQTPAQVPDVQVVVAATDIPLGTQISADKLATTTRPPTDAVDTYQNPEDLVGKVVRRAVGQGAALTPSDFETTVSVPEIASSLRPGLRAIAVPLDSVNSIGSLLQAGDYVDVIISLEELDGLNPVAVPNPNASVVTTDGSVPPPYVSIDDVINNTSVKVVVQNVQVLATIVPTPVDDGSGNSTATDNPPVTIVLLAVTPQQAEVVRFAQLDGNVTLILRAPADSTADDNQTSGITLKELVDHWGVLPPQPVTP